MSPSSPSAHLNACDDAIIKGCVCSALVGARLSGWDATSTVGTLVVVAVAGVKLGSRSPLFSSLEPPTRITVA